MTITEMIKRQLVYNDGLMRLPLNGSMTNFSECLRIQGVLLAQLGQVREQLRDCELPERGTRE